MQQTTASGADPTALDGTSADADTPLPAILVMAVRQRRLIIGLALLCGALVAALTITRGRAYSSTVVFVPQSRQSGGSISGLAAQFGVALGGGDGGHTPQFYAELLSSRAMLADLVDAVYDVPTDSGQVRGSLTVHLKARGDTPALRREDAITRLRDGLQATAAQKTDFVTVTVRTGSAALSREVAQQALDLVNRFNTETRQSQARAERRFSEARLDEARVALARAEDRLRGFSEANRAYQDAPGLVLERGRLQREVDAQQRLYLSFNDAFVKARLDEVRDTPVITVVARPEVPVRPDARGLVLRTAFGVVGGLVLGILLAAASAALLASRRRHPAHHVALRDEVRGALDGVGRRATAAPSGAASTPASA